jgi:uncharacterized surface protein with fasciclin (FAS1) repeats
VRLRGKNIVDIARESGRLTTLLTAVDRAGLRSTFAGAGPLTVFAPEDDAFARLPLGAVDSLLNDRAQLTRVLTYHLVRGRVRAADVAELRAARTVQGEDLPFGLDGGIRVENARVVDADLEASNGVLHVIDRVLLPAAI